MYASVANAQNFQWPLSPFLTTPSINQDYACKGKKPSGFDSCVLDDKYHTGLDMTSTSNDQGIYAAEGGTVLSAFLVKDCDPDPDSENKKCNNEYKNCNSGFGNTVLIQHNGGLYSLYAHLQKGSEVVPGGVSKEAKIGTMGNTGCSTGPHLHFEIKDSATLGGGYTKPPDVGYPAPSPDAVGYFDPWKYIASTAISLVPVKVVNPIGLNVRRGPGTNYSTFTEIGFDQRFVALAKDNGWYRIYLPCGNSSCAGWIAGTLSGVTYSVEDPSANQLEVKNTEEDGIGVFPGPSATSPISRVWEGQKFITFGTPTSGTGCEGVYRWHQIYLPQNAGAQSGWVCNKWAQPLSVPPPPSSPSVSPVTLQGQAVPGIANGEFLGFGGSRLNNAGDVVFGADVDTDDDGLSNRSGFFKDSQGTKSKIVATGESTATSIGSLNFLDVNAYNGSPAPINDDGDMVFRGAWDEADGRHNGNFLASNGSITKLFESGEQVTVRRGTGTFEDVRAGPINDQGDIAFTASVVVNNFSAFHIFLAPSGCRNPSCLTEIAAAGEATGVTGVGGTFDSGGLIGTPLSLTSDGDVIFHAIINGGSTSVAYLLFDRDTGLKKKIVAAGDVAPSGRIFNGVSLEHVAPNGKMVFFGRFPDPSPTPQGIYYISSVSAQFPQMKKVVEEGDRLMGASDTFTLLRTGPSRASVNSDGSVAFSGKFFPVGSPLEKIDGVFVWTGGKFVQMALEGDCTPIGGAYGGASDPHLNDSGKVVLFNPRIALGSCPPIIASSSSSPTRLFGWAALTNILPVTAHAQEAGSNLGVFDTLSPLDPDPELFRLTVSTDGTGSGIVTSSPEGIDCGETCQALFDSNIEVTLTAIPEAGSVFAGWGGACAGMGNCLVSMTDDQAVTASFTFACGNGIVEGSEQCDPGADIPGDCCTAACTLVSVGTECRATAGECDQAEICNGSSPSCPADTKKASGTACTDDGNACTLDQCNGSAVTCQHPAGNAGTVCRVAAGACDAAESCSGTNTTCPANGFASSSTVCLAAAGECDQAENCTGTSATCPADAKKASGTSCSDDGTVCTADICNGSSATCTHPAGNAGTVCRGAAGACDAAESCSGTNTTCPADAKSPAGTLCPDDGSSCTNDMCDGSGACTHPAKPVVCGDGAVCGAEVCDPPGVQDGCASGKVCNTTCSACVNTSATLIVSLSAIPKNVYLARNKTIKVRMKVKNIGPQNAIVAPLPLTVEGTGSAQFSSGPKPEPPQTIKPGRSKVFTWLYQATTTGQVRFTGKATSPQGESPPATSNDVTIR